MARVACFEKTEVAHSAAGENLGQLLRWNYFELVIRAFARPLVFAPSSKLRRVTEPAALHVIVSDFDYKLRTQGFPRQVLVLTPAAQCPGHAMPRFTTRFMLSPMFPGMGRERVLAVWRKVSYKLSPHLVREARADADMLERG